MTSNNISNNTAVPAPLIKIVPKLNKADEARLLQIAAKQADFNARRDEFGRLRVRGEIREQARAFAEGKGPKPTQTADQAEETAMEITKQLRAAYNRSFDSDAAPFLRTLLDDLVARCGGFLKELEARHAAEAEDLGVSYIAPPVVKSVARTLSRLESDRAMLDGKVAHTFNIAAKLLTPLGLQLPADSKRHGQ